MSMNVGALNQLEAYKKAYELALENAEIWLDLAGEALGREYYGQSYSSAIIANEEVVKAFVSWMVSQEYLLHDDDTVEAVYRWHIDKEMISLSFHYEVIVQQFLKVGLVDVEEVLGAIVTVSPEDVAKTLREHAEEMEDRRKDGVYVGRPRKTDGDFSITSPADFPKTRAENLIELVGLFHRAVKLMLESVEKYNEVREWFESEVEEIADFYEAN
jgi:AbiV family abortive infection protein